MYAEKYSLSHLAEEQKSRATSPKAARGPSSVRRAEPGEEGHRRDPGSAQPR